MPLQATPIQTCKALLNMSLIRFSFSFAVLILNIFDVIDFFEGMKLFLYNIKYGLEQNISTSDYGSENNSLM